VQLDPKLGGNDARRLSTWPSRSVAPVPHSLRGRATAFRDTHIGDAALGEFDIKKRRGGCSHSAILQPSVYDVESMMLYPVEANKRFAI
jgi:hypothetical protein